MPGGSVRPIRSRLRGLTGWAGVAVYAWVGAGFPSLTWQATVAVLLPGAAVLLRGTVGPPPERPPAPHVGRRAVLVWSVPFGAFCLLEIVNDLLGSTWEHPTLSVLLDPALARHDVRAAALFSWLAAGWWLVRR